MKVVHYSLHDPAVGSMLCPSCRRESPAWRSSGMSDLAPHFYCDRCSNALRRRSDAQLIHGEELSFELVERVGEQLPDCPCGGRFCPGANPNCLHCGAEFTHQNDPVQRLLDPHVILLDGSCLLGGEGDPEPYQVRIGP
jgi:hypothetical protein